jgi:hypothetical protein
MDWRGMEGIGGDRMGVERIGFLACVHTGAERTGQQRRAVEWKGHLSGFHKAVERRGGDRSGKEGIGLDGFSFQASTKDRTGVERNGSERRGEALLCFNLGREHERRD